MQALHFSQHGDISRLRFGERPDPVAGPGEVVVAVRAAALNHLDLFVLQGIPGVPVTLPHIGGADGTGVVTEIGDGVQGWRPGDEVVFNPGLWCGGCEFCRRGEESLCTRYGLLGEHVAGSFAEFVKVSAAALARKPAHLNWEEAAALPLTFLTAWRMLMTRGRLAAGETVLIHGIGGGVALAALALAKRTGARVFVTSSSDNKLRRALEMGADVGINYERQDVAREIRAATDKRGVDLVVETVGEATWMTSLKSAAKGGRIVTCGATSGPNPAEEIRLIFWNQLSILGSTMGSRADFDGMLSAVTAGAIKPVVDSVLPLARGHEGYQRMADGGQFGKIVFAVGTDSAASRERKAT